MRWLLIQFTHWAKSAMNFINGFLFISLIALAQSSYAHEKSNPHDLLITQKTTLYKKCEQKIHDAYKKYPAQHTAFDGKAPKQLNYIKDASRFASQAKLASGYKPKIAYIYSISVFGCGTECLRSIIVDLKSGAAFLGPDFFTDIESSLESRVVVADREPLKDYLSNQWSMPVSVWVIKNKKVEKLFTCHLDALNEH